MSGELLVGRHCPGEVVRKELDHITLQIPNEDLATAIVALLVVDSSVLLVPTLVGLCHLRVDRVTRIIVSWSVRRILA